MRTPVSNQKVKQKTSVATLLLFIHNRIVESKDEVSNFATFGSFPNVARDIEEKSLEKENKTHPLVVGMVDSLSFIFSFASLFVVTIFVNSWIWNFHTHFFEPCTLN